MTSPYVPGTVIDDLPVFPLPQIVLFPGAMMPLHIFEPRYRAMVRDALAGTKRLVVALIPEEHHIKPCGQPSIAPVAGLGEIVHADPLPDGRFNIMVEGKARIRLEELPFKRPYRRARGTVLGSSEGAPVEPALLRALAQSATQVAAAIRSCHPSFQFSLPPAGDADALADACAHYLILDGGERQKLLEELDPAQRVMSCLAMLMAQKTLLGACETMH